MCLFQVNHRQFKTLAYTLQGSSLLVKHVEKTDIFLTISVILWLFSSLPPSLPSRPLGCAEADDVLRKCEHVLEVLHQHDEELFSEWTEGLELICQSHLNEPLLMLDPDTGLFQVNFSPAVSETYRSELKYLYLIVLSVQGAVRCGTGAAFCLQSYLLTQNIKDVTVHAVKSNGKG